MDGDFRVVDEDEPPLEEVRDELVAPPEEFRFGVAAAAARAC